MKKEYVTPTMVGERFSADEYVAACITGVIQCAYPGDGKTNGMDIMQQSHLMGIPEVDMNI